MAANIRVFCETTKFLEEFLILALISHRFGFTSHWSVGPVDKSPFGRRFSIHGFAQILSLQQRFSLSFAAIDISLHANYALILLNTNCTNYTNKVYHQYSVPTILQVVTPISFFEKSYFCIVLQKISCTRQFERQLSLRSLASLFPIKEGIFLPLRLSCKESSTS